MNYILYNTKSNSGKYQEALKNYKDTFSLKGYKELDVISFNDDYREFLYSLTKNDTVTIIGGDGTLNHFVNVINSIVLPCDFYFYPSGTGNDFFNDVKEKSENGRVLLNKFIKNLPYVLVNGKKYFFINGIGFGIDGYCCKEGDRLHALNKKDVNYTSIAIKGLLFHYKAPNAKITVDGVSKTYKRVWLAPTMKGRYYGGGMMVAPAQNRLDENNLVSNVVMYKSGKLKTLMVFPSIFKGEHVKHTEMVEIRQGKDIIVEFDKPQALQIDGETISNVLKYEVHVK